MGCTSSSSLYTKTDMSSDNPKYIIKVGGAVLEDKEKTNAFVQSFCALKVEKTLVHGGGRKASAVANDLGIRAPLVEGRRITDDDMLEVAVMVYAGLTNKKIVAQLQANGCNALGLSGADGNLIEAHKRPIRAGIDYGWAGDIDHVNCELLQNLLSAGLVPVVASITHDGLGNLLNTNADTIANEIAIALGKSQEVHLVYLFEERGVMQDLEDKDSLISHIDKKTYHKMKESGKIHSGMIPKLDNAFHALSKGVNSVRIGNYASLASIINDDGGGYTLITND